MIYTLVNVPRTMYVGGDPVYLGSEKGHVRLTMDRSMALEYRRRSTSIQAADELAARTGEEFVVVSGTQPWTDNVGKALRAKSHGVARRLRANIVRAEGVSATSLIIKLVKVTTTVELA